MAINKITSKSVQDLDLSADDLAPGTITDAKIATGTIANDKLANTSITINGTSIALGASGDIVAGTDWQSVVVADGSTATTASAGEGYFIDTTSAAHTITLPADGSSTIGDTIIIRDYAGTFATNNVTLTSTAKISGADADGILSTNDLVVTVVYVDSTKGWVTIENEAKAVGASDFIISATGGTVTESGDYRIHSFTGDGSFTVSCIAPTSPGIVDYIVVAGGGGGGGAFGGGGGAGGFREGKQPGCSPHTASPLAATSGIPISTTTYPVTIGAGAAGNYPSFGPKGSNGSNSVFSTITSTGGGGGSGNEPPSPSNNGQPGGSGGGGGYFVGCSVNSAGSGNTPPTSPSQGNNGGTASPPPAVYAAGGGGGATAVGRDGDSSPRSCGGAGATSSISGSPTAYAGGGGGGSYFGAGPIQGCGGSGGIGGGGDGGGGSPAAGCNGVANTGGGGGGHGGAGGKGIVILRYKFQ